MDLLSSRLKAALEEAFSSDVNEHRMELEDDVPSEEVVVEDYFHLIQTVCEGEQIHSVELSEEEPLEVTINGKIIDLGESIEHDDEENTERIMEIEALFSDGISVSEVQAMLMERIIEQV